MPYQLRCSVHRDGASPAYLREDDAWAAWGSSELLRVVSHSEAPLLCEHHFPPRRGFSRGMVIEARYQVTTAGPAVNRLVREFLAATRGIPDSSAHIPG